VAKAYPAEELALRTFLVTMVGLGAWIAVVFLFIL